MFQNAQEQPFALSNKNYQRYDELAAKLHLPA